MLSTPVPLGGVVSTGIPVGGIANHIAAEDHVVARAADDRVVARTARQRAWRQHGRTRWRRQGVSAKNHVVAGAANQAVGTSPADAWCRHGIPVGGMATTSPPKITSLPEPPMIVSLPVPPDSVLGGGTGEPTGGGRGLPPKITSLPAPPDNTVGTRAADGRVDRHSRWRNDHHVAAEDHVVAAPTDHGVVARTAGERTRRNDRSTGRRRESVAAKDHVVAGPAD